MKKKSPDRYVLDKTLLIMKLTIILSLFFTLNAFSKVYSQKDRLSIHLNNATLEKAFEIIEKEGDYEFFYHNERIDLSERVSIQADNELIENILFQLFESKSVDFKIVDKSIILTAPDRINHGTELQNQKVKITGRVVDVKGEPIPGVNVYEKTNPQNGVITGGDGYYSIDADQSDVTLVFSFIGFEVKEIATGGETVLDVVLIEEAIGLDEVVAIGYGTQRRSLVTNAISNVKVGENDIRSAALSPTQLLEGKVPGVSISSGSGNLGSRESIRIRGISSLSAGNEPLYVIDGVPVTNSGASIYNMGESMSSLSTINLNDIESISVLKDAASAAIYGSRATNGVVVITTKSGKGEKSELRVNADYSLVQFARKDRIEFSDSELWLEAYNEGIDNYNHQYDLEVGDSGYKTHMMHPFPGMADTDWLDLITQIGHQKSIDVAASGGSKKSTYYLGVAYSDKEGVIKNNSVEKINLRANVSSQLFSWLKLGANVSANYMKNNQVPGANTGTTILARAVEQRPFDRPLKPNGDYYIGGTDQLTRHNPVQILNEQVIYVDNLRYLGSYWATFNYKDKLTWKATFNTDISYTYDYTNFNEFHPYGTGVGRIVEYHRLIPNILGENVVTYNDDFNDLHVNVMAGHSIQTTKWNTSMIDGRGYPSPAFDVTSVASEIFDASGNLSEFAMESYFSRASLSYKDKYIFNASIRTDGSSKFAKENRWGVFPSVSAGWNISKERFMEGSTTDIKLRMSFGETGNQGSISNYAWHPLMSGGANYGNEGGIAVTSFGNPDLTWETTRQFDIGADVAFWNGKVNFLIDYYVKNTHDLLYNMPVHATTGVTSQTNNIGSLRNRGIEFALNTHINIKKLRWTSQFNISFNNNEITELLDDNKPISIGDNRVLQVGDELGAACYYV